MSTAYVCPVCRVIVEWYENEDEYVEIDWPCAECDV